MAKVVIRLRVDPATGKKEVVIDYQSDSDALPIEHEEEHRRLVEKVVPGGLQGAGRDGDEAEAVPEKATEQPQDARVAEKQK